MGQNIKKPQELLDKYNNTLWEEINHYLIPIQAGAENFDALSDDEKKNLEILADRMAQQAARIIDTVNTGRHIPPTANKKSAFYSVYKTSTLCKIRKLLGYNF